METEAQKAARMAAEKAERDRVEKELQIKEAAIKKKLQDIAAQEAAEEAAFEKAMREFKNRFSDLAKKKLGDSHSHDETVAFVAQQLFPFMEPGVESTESLEESISELVSSRGESIWNRISGALDKFKEEGSADKKND
jgi:hypothetical protein